MEPNKNTPEYGEIVAVTSTHIHVRLPDGTIKTYTR